MDTITKLREVLEDIQRKHPKDGLPSAVYVGKDIYAEPLHGTGDGFIAPVDSVPFYLDATLPSGKVRAVWPHGKREVNR